MRLFSGIIGAGIVSTLQMVPALQSSGGVKVCRKSASLQISQLLYQLKNFSKTDFHFWRNSKSDPCLLS